MPRATERREQYGRAIEELNVLDEGEEDRVFYFDVTGRDDGTDLDDGKVLPRIRALGDTGANCNVASTATIAAWEAAGCVVQSQRLKATPIRLGGRSHPAQRPIIRRVRVRLTLHLDSHDLQVEEWVCEWPDLTEALVLSYGTLKRYYLLAYMQTHIAPAGYTEEELRLDEIQAPPPRAQDFVQGGTRLDEATILSMIDDPARVNRDFPDLERLRTILCKYGPTVFAPRDTMGLQVSPAVLRLRDPSARLPRQACRFVSRAVMPHLEYELKKMEEKGIIRRVTEATCCSPLCITPKADGYIRLAIDYRLINDLLEKSALPIPQMGLLFDYFKNCQYFAGLDALDGYFQHPLAEESKYLTCFTTPFGLFEFNFLPQGICNAPGIFSQSINDDILSAATHPAVSTAKAAVNFIDDTGVGGTTADEFCDRLELVLRAFAERNARLKWDKCTFGFQQLEYVGHVFDSAGYRLSERRKQGLVDMATPNSVKHARGFIGLCQYFSKFIPNLATELAPITDTLSSAPFVWTPAAHSAFLRVKEKVLSSGHLHHVEEGGELILHTDASTIGIGGYLFQRVNGEERPIAYVSHKFSPAARNWSTIEQEAYAIVYCVLKLETFLLGRRFLIRTDHRNLIFILGSTIPKIVRWRLRLAEYEYSVEHVPGVDNVVADNLSRVLSMTRARGSTAISLDNASAASSEGAPATQPTPTPPVDDLDELVLQIHNSVVGHHGIRRTEHALTVIRPDWQTFSRAKERVRSILQQCPICQKLKGSTEVVGDSIWHHLVGSEPLRDVSSDVWGPFPEDVHGNRYVVGIVCNLTRFAMGVPVPGCTAADTARALCTWAGVFGWPKSLRTDKGTGYTGDVCTQISKLFGVQHVTILAGHHAANGIIERRFRETSRHLKAMLFNPLLRDRWSEVVPIAFGITNRSVDRRLGYSPSRLVLGPFAASMDEFTSRRSLSSMDDVTEFVQMLDKTMAHCVKLSREHLQAQLRMEDVRKGRVERVHKGAPLSVGDYVLREYATKILPKAPTKLHPVYRGPLVVVGCERPDIVRCQDIITKQEFDVHTSELRHFHVADNVLPHELLQWAQADHVQEWKVEAVVAHRFALGKRRGTSSLELYIRWEGEHEDKHTWEPYAAVKEAELVDRYVLEHKLPRIKEKGDG